MGSTVSDISLLLQPSMRSIAYLRAFESVGLVPAGVILLEGAIANADELRAENALFGYGAGFFNVEPDILTSLGGLCPVTRVAANDVNSGLVKEALLRASGRYVLFCASGILGREIFATGKKFIHVHPGLLPHYRGSTCFYYSLLETGLLGSTAFFMDEGIDTGEIIATSKFSVNYAIRSGQRLFMDYILDPFIRSMTLKKVLAAYMDQGEINGAPQPPCARPAYYIVHPLLRRLAALRLFSNHDASMPEGVFEIKGDPGAEMRRHA